jgi:nucleotide-binding universal stress UspA family protein
MRAVVWVREETWRATVAAARALLPTQAEITLLYVTPSEAEALARGAGHGLLGRSRRAPSESLRTVSEQSARALLAAAQALLGREATSKVRSGRVEDAVLAAAEGVDLLILSREGDRTVRGPRSLGPGARFVVDHAPCAVLLVWLDSSLER